MSMTGAEENGPQSADDWEEVLYAAFDRRDPHPLAPAEEALRACPGHYALLNLAVTAALVEAKPDRALVFLKRLSKRYEDTAPHHLLQGLALAHKGNLTGARRLLERYGLLRYSDAMPYFPGGGALGLWLNDWLSKIRGDPMPGRKKAAAASSTSGKGKTSAKGKAAPAQKGVPGKPAKANPAQAAAIPPSASPPASPPAPAPVGLPRLEVSIPVSLNFDAAADGDPDGADDADGGWFRLRESFVHLGLAQGFDELLCLPHLTGVQTHWYQVETVRKVLKRFRGRVLLADEVGLGKTIEACMVLKEYLLRAMAERVLILVPASLVGQWREELESKFAISCATTHDPLLREDPERFWAQPRIVASLAVARRREHAERLKALAYDLVIVDEAHHLRDRASQSYKLVDALNKRFLLLLSATPVQNSLIELYNLLTLLKPGIVKTQKEFRAAYMAAGKPRQPANPERLRALMRDVMIRNTRAVVALRLPRRQAATLRVEGTEAERAAYAATEAMARRLAEGEGGGRHRLAVRHLLEAAGSSPAAAAAAARRNAARHPDVAPDVAPFAAWTDLAMRWDGIARGAKEKALLDLLRRNPDEKKLVFIHHRESLAHVGAMLGEAGIPFVRFAGDLSGPDKDAAVAAFRDRVPVLLCTESGGEGRNLQFCNTLINFDIPWNPMAIEQRIGRIDRIGQEREVFIFNLATAGTLEDSVLRILDEKINMFELVVGEVGAILGELEEERDFAELVLDAWLATTEAGATEAGEGFDALGDRVTRARRQYEDVKILDDALFGEAFES
ncbi:DEAD/DEAH box helicase [Azospirillum endophyticum]